MRDVDVIDIEKEQLISLKEAARRIPGRAGKSVSRATIWRWALIGRRGAKLETLLLGDRFTSIEAIGRFVAKLNGTPTASVQANRSAREAERVDRLLAAEGF